MILYSKKFTLCIIFYLLLSFGCHQAANYHSITVERTKQQSEFRDTKINNLINGLALSNQEAGLFDEVFLEYSDEKWQLVQYYNSKIDASELKDISDETYKKRLTNNLKIKEGLIKIEEKYISKFDKVIPIKKVGKMYNMESKMMDRLLDTNKAQNGGNRKNQKMQQRSKERMNKIKKNK